MTFVAGLQAYRNNYTKRFQKCDYAGIKLFKTEGRGWGALADENIKSSNQWQHELVDVPGAFKRIKQGSCDQLFKKPIDQGLEVIVEYCGEVISWKEAKSRSQSYETQGFKDAYIISLHSHESTDATMNGSFASQPNCEMRKWNVLGEVGIFAKYDIPIGTELGYDYNFEWYGVLKCAACVGLPAVLVFLGQSLMVSSFRELLSGFSLVIYFSPLAISDRYWVEKIPLYNSAEVEPSSKFLKVTDASKPEFTIDAKNEGSMMMAAGVDYEDQLESNAFVIEPLDTLPPMKGVVTDAAKTM
ncbi:LOW QUALITY PROTEIN: hypothetical protein RJ641_029584 [Dillenia turbinata]|uniref:SET domain-containing protein n=1 Tax=Dillenia turbinata TaxID=194707 RepID=A0AAN8ZMV7_9MAGN